jgi:hypothetical protein
MIAGGRCTLSSPLSPTRTDPGSFPAFVSGWSSGIRRQIPVEMILSTPHQKEKRHQILRSPNPRNAQRRRQHRGESRRRKETRQGQSCLVDREPLASSRLLVGQLCSALRSAALSLHIFKRFPPVPICSCLRARVSIMAFWANRPCANWTGPSAPWSGQGSMGVNACPELASPQLLA